MSETEKKPSARVLEAARSFTPPKGWKVLRVVEGVAESSRTTRWPAPELVTVVLAAEGAEIEVFARFCESTTWGKEKGLKLTVDGTTRFKHKDFWASFDRIGVESSFYVDEGREDGPFEPRLAAAIVAQKARVEKYLAMDAGRVDVPGLPFGWRLSPEALAVTKTRLLRGETVTWTPSGFGTGYHLCVKPPRDRKSSDVSFAKATALAFFGVPSLWLRSFDHD